MPRGKGKRERWERNKGLACVHEPDLNGVTRGDTYLRGEWAREIFRSSVPITLELGCGQGLFAVDLARRHPDRSFVGIDVKGHRFWRGAAAADRAELSNIAFLRARVQWLDRFFGASEVREIWLTFTDPQIGDKRGTKRLTSPYYLRLYQEALEIGGRVLVKTDSPEFFERTVEDGPRAGLTVVDACTDVHGAESGRFDDELEESLSFITAYEERWLREGRRVRFVALEKTQEVPGELLTEAKAMLQGPMSRDRPRFLGSPHSRGTSSSWGEGVKLSEERRG